MYTASFKKRLNGFPKQLGTVVLTKRHTNVQIVCSLGTILVELVLALVRIYSSSRTLCVQLTENKLQCPRLW